MWRGKAETNYSALADGVLSDAENLLTRELLSWDMQQLCARIGRISISSGFFFLEEITPALSSWLLYSLVKACSTQLRKFPCWVHCLPRSPVAMVVPFPPSAAEVPNPAEQEQQPNQLSHQHSPGGEPWLGDTGTVAGGIGKRSREDPSPAVQMFLRPSPGPVVTGSRCQSLLAPRDSEVRFLISHQAHFF